MQNEWIELDSYSKSHYFDFSQLLFNDKPFDGNFLELDALEPSVDSITRNVKIYFGNQKPKLFHPVNLELEFVDSGVLIEALEKNETPDPVFVGFLNGESIECPLEYSIEAKPSLFPNMEIAEKSAGLLACNGSRYLPIVMKNPAQKISCEVKESSIAVEKFEITTNKKKESVASFTIKFVCKFWLEENARDLFKELKKGPFKYGTDPKESIAVCEEHRLNVLKTVLEHHESIYVNNGNCDSYNYADYGLYIALRPKTFAEADSLFLRDLANERRYCSSLTYELQNVMETYYSRYVPKKISKQLRDVHLNGCDENTHQHFRLNWKRLERVDANYISTLENLLSVVEGVKKNNDGFYLDTKVLVKSSISIRLEHTSLIPKLYAEGFGDPAFLKNQKRIERYLDYLKIWLNSLIRFSKEVVFENNEFHSFEELIMKAVKRDPLDFVNSDSDAIQMYSRSLLNGTFYGDTAHFKYTM